MTHNTTALMAVHPFKRNSRAQRRLVRAERFNPALTLAAQALRVGQHVRMALFS